MKVNSITNIVSNYKKNTIQNQHDNNTNSYGYNNTNCTTSNFAPNFTGLFNLGQKGTKIVAKAAEQKGPTAKSIIKNLENMWTYNTEFYPNHQFKSHLELIKRNMNDETTPFIDSLIKKIPTSSSIGATELTIETNRISNITEKYTKNPHSRALIEKASNETINDETRFDLWDLDREGIFGDCYDGSEAQNKLIEMMLEAKDLDGSKRFNSSAFYNAEKHFSPKNREAIDLLMQQTVTPVDFDYKKIARLISEDNSDTNKFKESIIKSEPVYLIDSNASWVDDILREYSPEKLPALKAILPFVTDAKDIGPILKHYTSDKHNVLLKTLKIVDNSQLTIEEVPSVLKHLD